MLRPLVLFWFIFMMVTLRAQSRLDSTQRIPEILVQAEYFREVLKPQRLSGKLLQGLSTHSVADAIRYFSGVQIKDYGGVGGVKTVNIRSMGSHHVGVFYDGIQLGNAQNGQVDLGKYSLDNMEAVVLYAGQKSDLFQSARDFSTSGSIYLHTRRPRFESDKNYNLITTFRTGSFGLANPSLLWEQKLGSRVNMSFNTEGVYATGKYKYRDKKILPSGEVAYDTTAVRHNGDIRSVRGELAFFGTTDTDQWNTKIYFYDSERGIPGAVVNNVYKRGERQWDRNLFVQGSFQKIPSDRYRMKISGKYAHDYTRFLREDPKELPIDNAYRQQEGYVSAVQLYSIFTYWDWSLATDFQWNKLDANLQEFAYPVRYTEMIALATHLKLGKLNMQGNLLAT
ncbi:MAG: TonB-dependent receptor plug domain-containing protein, partial [Bacteroidales bacterium]